MQVPINENFSALPYYYIRTKYMNEKQGLRERLQRKLTRVYSVFAFTGFFFANVSNSTTARESTCLDWRANNENLNSKNDFEIFKNNTTRYKDRKN